MPLYSTVLNARVDGPECGTGYWMRNLREPVLFSDAVQALIRDGHDIFVEVSPHPILLAEMFSRWPRYLSHGPAAEMWSVVHLPCAFISTGRPTKSLPSHAGNGSSSCSRSLVGFDHHRRRPSRRPAAAVNVSSPGS